MALGRNFGRSAQSNKAPPAIAEPIRSTSPTFFSPQDLQEAIMTVYPRISMRFKFSTSLRIT
jgi:hypothetical protein